MGLLDSLAGQAMSALTGGSGNATATVQPGILDAVGSLINSPQLGGLSGLIAAFQQKGLGEAAASWVGTGHNLPISADQLQAVLGSEQVQAIAQKLGFSPADAAHALATYLPQVVDKLTPNGHVPSGDLVSQGLSMLQSLGGKA